MTKLERELRLTGWFKKFHGPAGAVPVQFFAILTGGEYVYFRARGRKVSLRVYRNPNEDPIRRYERFVRVDHELGAGLLETAECIRLIKRWLSKYFIQVGGKEARCEVQRKHRRTSRGRRFEPAI